MFYSRIPCAKVDYTYLLKFIAVNENFVGRKPGVRFGVCSVRVGEFQYIFTKPHTRH